MKMNSLKLYYTNIVKNTTGNVSIKIRSSANNNDEPEVVKEIAEIYKNHPGISISKSSINVEQEIQLKILKTS